MTEVVFYQKPGCAGNARPKKLLKQSGHKVIEKDLLTENWRDKPDFLRQFFAQLPVADWFNRNAPTIKNGAIKPETVSAEQAIELMLEQPLLIRRPLMQVGEDKVAGFDQQQVNEWIGLADYSEQTDMEACRQADASQCRHD